MSIYRNNNNYMRDKKNNDRNFKQNSEESLKTDYKNKVRYEEKYGKYYSLMVEGAQDRISGNPPQSFENESMSTSYNYGYFERGSRVLSGKFAKGIYTEEEQRNFGITDLINGVADKFIKGLKEYPAYIEGRIYQMGRNAYDYVIANNISLEKYIYVMEFIYPEVKTLLFKEGYFSKQYEVNNAKNR